MGFLDDIQDYIKSGETGSQNLGLEIEHFVVNDEGVQIEFHEVSDLIDEVGKRIGAKLIYMDGYTVGYANDKYTVTLEPSCQFEISINPYSDLSDIKEVYEEFISLWGPIFELRGYHFVTKGNLPLVETGVIKPDDIPLSPKKRYKYMDEYFKESGKYGKYMMRASGSAQVSVDYKSEKDLLLKLRVLQKISPILMIIMENKSDEQSHLPGTPEKTHLLRTQEWDDLDPGRTGFYPESDEEDFGYAKIADVIYHTPLILLTDRGETTYVGSDSAADLVEKGELVYDDLDKERKIGLIEHFMSMGFFHFRIKKYIEIRVADSVPIEKALGYTALLKGIIYNDKVLRKLDEELADLNTLDKIQNIVLDIEKNGKEAIFSINKTVADWNRYLVKLAKESLPENERDYLNYV